jgi:hypothetical protein
MKSGVLSTVRGAEVGLLLAEVRLGPGDVEVVVHEV